MGLFQAVTGSVIMGLAIAGMHYIGMAAMRLSAVYVYSPLFVSLSILTTLLSSEMLASRWSDMLGRRTDQDFKALGQGRERRNENRRVGRLRPAAPGLVGHLRTWRRQTPHATEPDTVTRLLSK
jgi:hypothetical protein